GGVLNPIADVLVLLLELGRVGCGEIVIDGRTAHVEAEPGAFPLEMGEVFRRRLAEVILREFHRVEVHVGGDFDELIVIHRRFRLLVEFEMLGVTVAGDAEANVRLAGSANWINGGGRGRGNGEASAGDEKLTAGWHRNGSGERTTE